MGTGNRSEMAGHLFDDDVDCREIGVLRPALPACGTVCGSTPLTSSLDVFSTVV